MSVTDEFSWHVVAGGKQLSSTSDLLSTMPQLVSCVRDVIKFLDSLVPCCGNDDKRFLPLITSRNGSFPSVSGKYMYFVSLWFPLLRRGLCTLVKIVFSDITAVATTCTCNVYVECTYTLVHAGTAIVDKEGDTIRCTDCMLLVPESTAASRCHYCRLYRKTLFSLLTHYQNGQRRHSDGSSPSSHTNYRFLSTAEKDKRLQRLHHLHRYDQQKIARLRAALGHAIEQRGVTVDDDLHQDLQEIVKSNNECISNIYPPGSFARLFWENQMRASAVSKASSMRWDPLMIRWCLYLRHVSCSAYEMLRETGIVKLPSQRTLRDYTYTAKAAAGFSNEVYTHLLQAAKLDTCPDRKKHVILLMDEMHLREDLVYDRHSGLCVPMHTCTRTCTYVHV